MFSGLAQLSASPHLPCAPALTIVGTLCRIYSCTSGSALHWDPKPRPGVVLLLSSGAGSVPGSAGCTLAGACPGAEAALLPVYAATSWQLAVSQAPLGLFCSAPPRWLPPAAGRQAPGCFPSLRPDSDLALGEPYGIPTSPFFQIPLKTSPAFQLTDCSLQSGVIHRLSGSAFCPIIWAVNEGSKLHECSISSATRHHQLLSVSWTLHYRSQPFEPVHPANISPTFSCSYPNQISPI